MTHLRVLTIAAGSALVLALAVAGGVEDQPGSVSAGPGGAGVVLADVYLHQPRGTDN